MSVVRPSQQRLPARFSSVGPARRVVGPAERVKLREEVDERGDDHPFPRRLGAEQRHLGDHRPVVSLGRRDEVPQRARRPGDVRVGEEQVPRLSGRRGGLRGALGQRRGRRHALGHRPDLPGPAVRPGLSAGHGERRAAVPHGLVAEFGRDVPGPVAALVVDQDDAEVPRIVLPEERGKRHRQHGRLVPGRHDRRDRRPLAGGRVRPDRRQPLAGQPVPAVRDHQVDPGGRADGARDRESKHTRSLAQPVRPPPPTLSLRNRHR
jgi:hypothetical protein